MALQCHHNHHHHHHHHDCCRLHNHHYHHHHHHQKHHWHHHCNCHGDHSCHCCCCLKFIIIIFCCFCYHLISSDFPVFCSVESAKDGSKKEEVWIIKYSLIVLFGDSFFFCFLLLCSLLKVPNWRCFHFCSTDWRRCSFSLCWKTALHQKIRTWGMCHAILLNETICTFIFF